MKTVSFTMHLIDIRTHLKGCVLPTQAHQIERLDLDRMGEELWVFDSGAKLYREENFVDTVKGVPYTDPLPFDPPHWVIMGYSPSGADTMSALKQFGPYGALFNVQQF